MPRAKLVPSLLIICIKCIRTQILNSDLSAKLSASKLADASVSKLEMNPFHQLPASLLQEIITSLTCTYFGEKPIETPVAVLEHLITPQLASSRFSPIFSETYLSFFAKFGNLLKLNFKLSNVGDDSLQIVGNCCKNLRILNLDTCRNVTDSGIQWLCFASQGIETNNSELCKTLDQLLIYQTSVTKKGAQMALKYLTALTDFEHDTFFEILVELGEVEQHDNFSKVKILPFTTLLIANISPSLSGRFEAGLSLCPFISMVSIVAMKGLRDVDLLSLTALKKLNRLHIYGHPKAKEVEITFLGGVVPILQTIGISLELLDLSFFDTIDIWTVIKFCPNLISLTFNEHCKSLSVLSKNEIPHCREEKERFTLKRLKELDCAYSIPLDILHFLLSFPLLETICIVQCRVLTDEFLIDAVKYHRFQNLKVLLLEQCNLVTKKGINAFMTEHNALESISFHYCKNVSLDDIGDWQLLARHNNWKLNLDFKNSDFSLRYTS